MIATRRDENKKVLTYLFGLFDKTIVESYLEKGIGLPHHRVDYSGQLRFQNIYNVVLLLGLLDIVNFRVGEWKMGFWPNIGKSEPARPGFQMFPNSLFSLISRLLPYWLIKKDRKRVEQKQENRHTREKKRNLTSFIFSSTCPQKSFRNATTRSLFLSSEDNGGHTSLLLLLLPSIIKFHVGGEREREREVIRLIAIEISPDVRWWWVQEKRGR